MVELSNHTQLMNIMLGLSLNIPKWPHPLKDIKYNIDFIEPKIPEANPDIVFTNRKSNNSLVVDCKSRSLDDNQIKKYVNLRKNPKLLIERGLVSVPHHDHYSINPVITSFFDLSADKLITENQIHFLHVTKDNNHISCIEKKGNNFPDKKINEIFPIDTRNCDPPYQLYPFDENDKEIFTIHILRQLIVFGTQDRTFTVDDLLKEVHPYWDIIYNKKKFTEKATTLLLDLFKKGKKTGLSRYLTRDSKGWKVNIAHDPKSIQAFQKICLKIEESITYETLQETIEDTKELKS